MNICPNFSVTLAQLVIINASTAVMKGCSKLSELIELWASLV
jgi:hypothetical protein